MIKEGRGDARTIDAFLFFCPLSPFLHVSFSPAVFIPAPVNPV
jgi:hypothetical protein